MPVLVKLEDYGEGVVHGYGNVVLVAGSPLGGSGNYTHSLGVNHGIYALENLHIFDITFLGNGELKDDLAAYLTVLGILRMNVILTFPL